VSAMPVQSAVFMIQSMQGRQNLQTRAGNCGIANASPPNMAKAAVWCMNGVKCRIEKFLLELMTSLWLIPGLNSDVAWPTPTLHVAFRNQVP